MGLHQTEAIVGGQNERIGRSQIFSKIELNYITREVEKRHLLAEDIMWAQDNMLIDGS